MIAISLSGTDDVVALYTFFDSPFAKKLIPNLLCFSCFITLAGLLKPRLIVDVTDLPKYLDGMGFEQFSLDGSAIK